jgi:uncharacterized protein YebE (UPF0316 family)
MRKNNNIYRFEVFMMSKLLLIILVQLIYVPMLTLRTISMVKNLKIFTSIFGFLEALIYIFGLSIVLSGDQNVLEMFIYSLGFALGLVVGIYTEKKLAIGFININVNIRQRNDDMITFLRNQGFGVTTYLAEGRNGIREKLEILAKRTREEELLRYIRYYEPDAFIIAYEPKTFKGGYLAKLIKKRMEQRTKVKDLIKKSSKKSFINKIPIGHIKKEINELRKTLRK